MADTTRTFGLEHIGREIHLTTLGGRRDGATLCGTPAGRPSPRKIRGTCQKCAGWSRTIQTLSEIARVERATPYDHATEGL